MQNMNICKEVLHLFLQDTIEIKSITPQSTIDSFLKSKAVRLDVLVEDGESLIKARRAFNQRSC